MFNLTFDPAVNIVAALILSYVFVMAGLHKCRAPAEFATTLANYKILPEGLARQGVYLVPVAEIMTGVALLIPATARLAAFSAGALLCAYIAAIGINLLRGRRNIDCGCGGPAQKQTISEWMIVRNGLLLGLAFITVCQVDPRALLWFDWLTIILATVMGCLFYNIINQLLVNKDLLKSLA
ncbi:MAG: methylamine utilization protein MauE [Gammaproteobacteria bacterium]|nr:methylamine utilization protein MauE [Gammaproteobacteria bacterium]